MQKIKDFIPLTTGLNCQIYQGLEKVTGGRKLGRKIVKKKVFISSLTTEIYFFEIYSRFSETLGLGSSSASTFQHSNSELENKATGNV